jgi:hypothetical protein
MVAQAGRLYNMSHNKLTVQNQSPDSAGNISLSSLNIGDLNNVTITTPSTDQVIKYIQIQ